MIFLYSGCTRMRALHTLHACVQIRLPLRPRATFLTIARKHALGQEFKSGIRNVYSNGTAAQESPKRAMNLRIFRRMYKKKEPIAVITAYDYPSAKFASNAGADLILVGDSMGMVVHGNSNTISVTMDDMIRHCKAVRKGANGPLVVADMPFGSFVTPSDAAANACRILKESGVDLVKLEGGKRVAEHVKLVTNTGIPVIGHIGLLPQTSTQLGGFCAQGKTAKTALSLLEDAQSLADAGCIAIVLECVPDEIARIVTENVSIPTIGIGAGSGTSGQVLVLHDVLGMYDRAPRFSHVFAPAGNVMEQGISAYVSAVKQRNFPTSKHTVYMKDKERDQLLAALEDRHDYKKTCFEHGATVSESATKEFLPNGVQHVCVIGGGAIGSLLTAKLANNEQGVKVTMLSSWEAHRNRIVEDGLVLQKLDGNTTLTKSINVAASPDNLVSEHGQVDLAIIATKGTHTEKAAAYSKQILRDGGCVLTVQNGINTPIIEKVLDGQYQTLPSILTHGAKILQAGQVAHTGEGCLFLGLNNEHLSEDAESITELFTSAGLPCQMVKGETQVTNMIWRKLLVNAVVNPLTAIFAVKNGDLLRNTQFVPLMEAVINESLAVAAAKGIVPILGEGDIREAAMSEVRSVLETTAANTSSMLSDVQRSQETEIACITGYLVHEGARLHVPTPILSFLTDAVAAMNPPHDRSIKFSQISSIQEMQDTAKSMSMERKTIGCVPTMGGIHEGHLDLVRAARKYTDVVVATVFLNKKQFAAHEDLDKYPQSLERDITLLRNAGADIVFTPSSDEMYPPQFRTNVELEGIDDLSEGKSRPGFFKGVATVVSKLFNIVRPDIAFFGQKDALQCIVIKNLVQDMSYPLKVHICPTAREPDGLAMSTRNKRLSEQQRSMAPVFYRTLHNVSDKHRQQGLTVTQIKELVREQLTAVPGIRTLDYVSIANPCTGEEIHDSEPIMEGAILSAAISLVGEAADGGPPVRLLDNIVL
eukprot:m.341759 g.341759  ORF g.341759 m.341759 type:complete len:989 (+) comp20460_c0_seq1:224-3190(+)